MEKAILIVSGGIEAVAGIKVAKDMGLHVVVSDMNPQAPGFAVADDTIVASTYDVEATVKAAREYHRSARPLDGVICIASDIPLTVACVAKELGLPGITVESANLSSDKLAMKQKFQSDGVPVPWFSQVSSVEVLRRFVDKQGYPLVIKPVDSRGARGVLRLTEDVELAWAFDYAKGQSPTGRVMLERFLDGPQVSTESIVLNGTAHTPGFADRNYELLDTYAPHMIENGGELPSHLPEATQEAVREVVQKAAHSMGIEDGVVKGDIVVHEGKPYVIELAARLSGGYFCTHEIPLNTGVDFVQQAIKLAIGEPVNPDDLEPRYQRPVSQRYLFPKPGRVVSITGVEEVTRRPNIALCEVRTEVGAIIGEVSSHPARAGVIIAHGPGPEQAREAAETAVRDIRIETALVA